MGERFHQNSKLNSSWHLAIKYCEWEQVMGNKRRLKFILEKNPVVLLLFRKHTQQFIGMKDKKENSEITNSFQKNLCCFPSDVSLRELFKNVCISYIYIHNGRYVYRYVETHHTLSGILSPKTCSKQIFLLPENFLQVFSWLTPQSLFSEFVFDDK